MNREVKQNQVRQGRDEALPYTLTTTPWGSDPTNPICTLYDVTNDDAWVDVTKDKLAGEPSIEGDVITTPLVYSLVSARKYRLEIRFTTDGNTWEPFVEITAER